MLRNQLHIETIKWFNPMVDYTICGGSFYKV